MKDRAPREPKLSKLNVPPEGFTALFNGQDFTGWRAHPEGQGNVVH